MQTKEHAKILTAYLSRLTLADVDVIQAANRTWTHAALNYGNNAQDTAQQEFNEAVFNAVAKMLPHDRARIEQTIDATMEAAA